MMAVGYTHPLSPPGPSDRVPSAPHPQPTDGAPPPFLLHLPELGYQVEVGPDQNGQPWVTWQSPTGGPRYVWICPFNSAMWAKDVTGGGVH